MEGRTCGEMFFIVNGRFVPWSLIVYLSYLKPQRCCEAHGPFPPLPPVVTDTSHFTLSSLKSKFLPRVPISVGKHIASRDG